MGILDSQHLQELFIAATEVPHERRAAFLDQACNDDSDLRARLESLLRAHDDGMNFIKTPPPERSLAMADAPTSHMVGKQVGNYIIQDELAVGGMGVVYRAEQQNPHRTVALKVIRPGLVTRSMLRRFEYEAQVLGQLQHQGIAQVFEAGTFDVGYGEQPFFAMEYIEGESLIEYARLHGLSARQRLELVILVCDAVQHAHQKGVIHRDLKPPNILVTQSAIGNTHTAGDSRERAKPVVKILDFGVARATDSDIAVTTLQTSVGQLIGTIAYMSPEQIAGDPTQLDTRSDVYSLGVICYELLCDRRPHPVERKGIADAVRIIEHTDPPSLSSINKAFRGDLDTIVAKAMEKNKSRRYQSALELADDIRRHLRHEPILARPATTMYQLTKFAHRNRALVTGVALAFVVLVVAVVVVSVALVDQSAQRRVAEQQGVLADMARQEAELQAANAEAVSRFLSEMLRSSDPRTALGKDVTIAREWLTTASQRVQTELADQPHIAANLYTIIGSTYQSIGLYDDAATHLALALQLRRAEHAPNHDAVAVSLRDLANLEIARGNYAEAKSLIIEAIQMFEHLHGPDHMDIVLCLTQLGMACQYRGEYNEAERHHNRGAIVSAAILGEEHPTTLAFINNQAGMLHVLGKYAAAVDLYRRVLEVRRRALPADHPDLSLSVNNMARSMAAMGHSHEAEAMYRESLEMKSRVLGTQHDSYATTLLSLASTLVEQERYVEATHQMREALEIYRATLGPEHPWVAKTLHNLAATVFRQGDFEQSLRLHKEALAMRLELLGENHPDVALSLAGMGSLHYECGEWSAALSLYEQALRIRENAFGHRHPDIARLLLSIGTLWRDQGDLDMASSFLIQASRMREELLGPEHIDTARANAVLGATLLWQGETDQAIAKLQQSLVVQRANGPKGHLELGKVLSWLGVGLLEKGQAVDAEPLLTEGLVILQTRLNPDHWQIAECQSALGECLWIQQRLDEPGRHLLKSNVNPIRKRYGEDHPATLRAIRRVEALAK